MISEMAENNRIFSYYLLLMLGRNLAHFSSCELKIRLSSFERRLWVDLRTKDQRGLKRWEGVKQVLVILSCSNVVCYYYGDPQTSKSDCGATKNRTEGKSHQGV